jgi:hypothetical protein
MWAKGVDGGQRKALSTGRARCADWRIVHMSTALFAALIDFGFGAAARSYPGRGGERCTGVSALLDSVSPVEDLPQET